MSKTGYNLINTITYGVLLVLGSYNFFKFLKKLEYKLNWRFFKHTLPFIAAVSVWHALTDAGVYPYGFFTTTPGLYIPVLAVYLPIVYFFRKNQNHYFIANLICLASQLIILFVILPSLFNLGAFLYFFAYVCASCIPFIFLKGKWIFKDNLNFYTIIFHMLDASATHVSLTYFNYFEQHVIPRAVINFFGTSLSFYFLKLIVLIPLLYYIDKSKDEKEVKNFVKMVFATYGFATGLRGALRLIMNV